MTIISVLIPFAGIIMGAIFVTKDKKLGRKLGEHLIIVCILANILYPIFFLGLFDFVLYVVLSLTPGSPQENEHGPYDSEINPLRILRFKK